jgi:prevent-host-death family protein
MATCLFRGLNRLHHIDHVGHVVYLDLTTMGTPPRRGRSRRHTVNIAQAKAKLPELVQRAAAGEEIIIARNGRPQARLTALEPREPRVPGRGAGQWKIAGSFNDPLPADVLASFYGSRR